MALVLGDVLRQPDFNLELVVGSHEHLKRPVAGAHAVEVPNPTRWLDTEWVMLTTGIRLRGDAAAQRQLVEEAAWRGLTAIGFALEVIYRKPPPAMLEEAARRNFPVFTVPIEVPFRDIIGYVDRSLASSDFQVLKRTIAIQNVLTDALLEEAPEQALVRRLGGLIESSVLLYGRDGRIAASTGEAPPLSIWRELRSAEPRLVEFQVGRWYVVSVPVSVGGVIRYWLALATRRRSISEQLAKPVIRSAARLLEVVARSREHAAAEERAVRSELLRRVLAVQAGDESLADRLAAVGFETGAACCLAVVAPAAGGSGMEAGRGPFEALLAESRLPYLLVDSTTHLIVLVQGRGLFEEWLRKLARKGVDLVVGVGRSVEALEDAADSLRDAELALEQLRREGPRGRVLRFEDLDLATLLISDLGPGRLQAKVDALIGPVRENEMLYTTLLAYLDADLDVGRTATALHLHANSLRYRLTQLEERLGRSLRSPATIANLYLATMADRSPRQGTNGRR